MFAYLETWELPAGGSTPEPQPDDLLPVGLAEDGRLEIAASTPTEAERDEALKRALHRALQQKAAELARLAGNQFPRLAGRARSLSDRLDADFEDVDLLLVHMDVEDLKSSYDLRDQRRGEDKYSPDVVDGMADVVNTGPGLTLDHPDVELLEERKRRFAADPAGSDVRQAHDAMSRAVASDEVAIGDRLRDLETRLSDRDDPSSTGAMQVSVHRNLLIRIGRVAKVVVGGAAGSALWYFVQANSETILPLLSSYGVAFADWFLAAMSQVEQLAGVFANAEKRPIERPRKDESDS